MYTNKRHSSYNCPPLAVLLLYHEDLDNKRLILQREWVRMKLLRSWELPQIPAVTEWLVLGTLKSYICEFSFGLKFLRLCRNDEQMAFREVLYAVVPALEDGCRPNPQPPIQWWVIPTFYANTTIAIKHTRANTTSCTCTNVLYVPVVSSGSLYSCGFPHVLYVPAVSSCSLYSCGFFIFLCLLQQDQLHLFSFLAVVFY